MRRPLYQALFGLTALLGSGLSAAEEATWFEVELVVFERPQTTSERFPEESVPLKTAGERDLLGPAVMPDISSLELALSDCQSFGWQPDQPECQPDQSQPSLPEDLPVRVNGMHMGDPRLGEPYLLPNEEMEFDQALARLKRGGVKLLLHTGWQQPVYSLGNSSAYRLYGGHNFADSYYGDGRRKASHPAGETVTAGFDLAWLMPQQASQTQALWQLDGWIRIYLNQFLHIDTQLLLREEGERALPMPEASPEQDALAGTASQLPPPSEPGTDDSAEQAEPFLHSILLQQSRRVRSREVHYFDHPRLGMVVQIRRMTQPSKMPPLEQDPPEQEAEPTSPQPQTTTQ